MFSLICAIRIADRVIEKKINKEYISIEEARTEAEKIQLAVAYRVFDNKNGMRVYTKKIEKGD